MGLISVTIILSMVGNVVIPTAVESAQPDYSIAEYENSYFNDTELSSINSTHEDAHVFQLGPYSNHNATLTIMTIDIFPEHHVGVYNHDKTIKFCEIGE